MPNQTELLDLLLLNRGIKTEYCHKFLNPSYEEGIYDPFLMKDMEKACVRIFEAIEAKEKIVIYSDYDCDGIPAAVMMHDFFQKINYPFSIDSDIEGNEVYKNNQKESFSYGARVYIPHRHDEGYGLHFDAVNQFIENGVNLIITFDLGITAIDEVAQAKTNGVDVIITDHHLPHQIENESGVYQDILPRAYAILNPKQEGCNYPDKMLCGAGVAYKLIQGLISKYDQYWKINKGWEKWLLDMVGVATLADQVPLLNENRVLAYYGLKVLRKGRRPGLVELFKKAGVDIKKLNEEDITFTLAPRINAASRMSDPMKAFTLLSTTDPVLAKTFSDYLVEINNERKTIVAHIMKEVKKLLHKREDKSIIVIGNPNWRIGVLGIVASKITEEYQKPAFVWGTDGNGEIRGSCRLPAILEDDNEASLVEIMSRLPEGSLLEFGGHRSAGGFSASHESIHLLEDRLVKVFIPNLSNQEKEIYNIEATILIDDVTNENYKTIEKLAPFGMSNPKPIFSFKKLNIFAIKEFGKDKNHLELIFKNSRGYQIKAISFFKTRDSFNNTLVVGQSIDLIANFEKNNFAGREELRLRILDLIN